MFPQPFKVLRNIHNKISSIESNNYIMHINE